MLDLSLPVSTLPLIGPKYAKLLASLGIFSLNDLVYYLPFRYDDLSLNSPISALQAGEKVTLRGEIISIRNIYTRRGKNLQQAQFSDGSGLIDITWFNQPYLVQTFQKQGLVSLSGTVKRYRNHLTLTSPQYEVIHNSPSTIHTGRLVPIYHITAGLTNKWLRSRIASVLNQITSIPDPLSTIAQENRLPPLIEAIKQLHFPTDLSELKQYKNRLGFDELFYLYLASLWRKRKWSTLTSVYPFKPFSQEIKAFIATFPFTLTADQNQCLLEILTDLSRPQPMNRLLQGDVGSGKTVLAVTAMYLAYLNGYKAVLMAPTEILANQHAQTLEALFKPLALSVSVQTSERHDPLEKASIIVGTHALLHRHLPENVALVVIDEQHRFGVRQRMQLIEKKVIPHLLSMTATPIPRTIALSLYADLNVSTLKQMPIGRKPVKTWIVPESKRPAAFTWMKKQIIAHKTQAFIICPFIENSENVALGEVKAVESQFNALEPGFKPLKTGMLHGSLPIKTKNLIMEKFKQHKLDILIATPVIEVGIDIPSATVIVIDSAERFGLAELHQLRGRVGRGEQPSYCLLFTSKNQETQRLKYLESTHSGFELAELDLKLRGPGQLYGIEQSGYLDLKFASFSEISLLQLAKKSATLILAKDPKLESMPGVNQILQAVLAKQTTAH